VSGYVEAGYTVILGSLALYGASLVARERAARRRLGRLDGGATTAPGGPVRISGPDPAPSGPVDAIPPSP
jgi:uncharacterized membrane protein